MNNTVYSTTILSELQELIGRTVDLAESMEFADSTFVIVSELAEQLQEEFNAACSTIG